MSDSKLSGIQALELASEFGQQGKFAEAEALYKQLLNSVPDDALVLYRLGLLYQQTGRSEDAVALLYQVVEQHPDDSRLRYNLGLCLQSLNRLAEAREQYQEALRVQPEYTQCLANLGALHFATGNEDEAEVCYRKALDADSMDASTNHNFGMLLAHQRRYAEAAHSLSSAYRANPGNFTTLQLLTSVLRRMDRLSEARELAAQALSDKPSVSELKLLYADLLVQGEQIEEAEPHYRALIERDPQHAAAHEGLGKVLRQAGLLEEALAEMQLAVDIAPEVPSALTSLGQILITFGRPTEAAELLRRSLAINPRQVTALYNLSQSKQHDSYDDEMRAMEGMLAEGRLDQGERSKLHFTLASDFDKLGESDRSFEHYVSGNRLRRESLNYSEQYDTGGFYALAEIFSGGSKVDASEFSEVTERPVFIVGMPRSGTSLAEQILASHPQIFGAGELKYFSRIWNELLLRIKQEQTAENKTVTLGEIAQLGRDYLERLTSHANGEQLITDKMPENYFHVGLIKTLWPDARIVHCRRHPLDTCTSIFTKNFSTDDIGYGYDLEELGRRYANYSRLMDRWNNQIDNAFFDLRYEALTENPEAGIRQLLDYVGVDFHPDCLSFHETQRGVRTASALQVKKPMYRSSVGAWRRFEKHLGPLIDAIGADVIKAYEAG
jgi:tetratricopeptide (TPR) repeat protein